MGLILLRHTRPAAPEGLCYGTTDLPLDEPALAERLPVLAATLPGSTGSARVRCRAAAASAKRSAARGGWWRRWTRGLSR